MTTLNLINDLRNGILPQQTINSLIDFCVKYKDLDPVKNKRAINNRVKAEANKISALVNQKPITRAVITIEWRKSRMWGSNCIAFANVLHPDGKHSYFNSSLTTGCGYCKESTALAEVLNQFLVYPMYTVDKYDALKDKTAPYGLRIHEHDIAYSGGVGVNSLRNAVEWLGFEFTKVTSTASADVYEIITKEPTT